nr:reverse transcriptase domain-containing protein [Tanacetum cinerariifolium]
MADQRTMAQLLQAPTKGYDDAIIVSTITADNFELKHSLLTLVQNKQFFGHDKEDPYAHVRYFTKITSTLKFPNVSNTSIKLMLFPFFLEGAARIWLEKEPPRSIFTWDDLVSKFINQFFPSSKTTSLRNEITNFQQRLDESFSEAWDRFKDLLRACPRHGNFLDKMPRKCLAIIERKSKVCYLRNKPVVAKVSTNASTSGVSPDVAELKDMVKALLLDKKGQNQSPAPMKAVEESCVTCGGAHSYRNFPATDGNNYRDNIQEFVSQASAVNFNKENTNYRPPMMSTKIRPPGFPPNQLTNLTDLITKFVNSNSASTSSSGTLPSNTIANPKSDLKEITTRSGVSYDGPQIPTLPYSLPKVVENEPEVTKDTVNPTNNENTEDVQPQAVQSESLALIFKPVTSPISELKIASVSASKPNPKASIPYLLRKNDERNREKANNQIEKFYQIFKDMSFKISFADALILMPKFASTLKALIGNKEKLSEMARTPLNEHCSAVLLKKLPEKLGDPGKLSLPDLTPTCMTLELADRSISRPVGVVEDVYVKVGSFHFLADFVVVDFDADPRVPLILKRSFLKTGRDIIDVFEGELTLRVGKEAITFNLDQTLRYSANYSDMTAKRINVIDMACEEYSQEVLGFSDTISSGNPTPYYDLIVFATSPTLTPFGNSDFLLEEVATFLAIEDEPTSFEFHQSYELKISEAKSEKSSVDEPPVVELKVLPPHLEYAFLEGDDKLSVIIAKYLSVEKTALITEFTFKVIDTKGAENLVAYHLSRLENPHKNVLDPKEINESFPLETVNLSSEGVYLARKPLKSSTLATLDQQETSGQVEVSNCGLKRILEGKLGENPASWSDKLDDALWAFRTTYKTPIECTPYKLVYEKACHLPVELEHKAYWALKHANFDLKTTGDHRKVQINELNELCDQANENSLIYKEKIKRLHDSKIKNHIFNIGDRVLLFNSRLKIFSGKLKSRWSGPFTISQVFPYDTVELSQPDGPNFKVNGHSVKHYFGEDIPKLVVPNL